MTPAVSVLMPVLNPHPVYFPEAVRSILAQTLTDWELVIVEDPSPSSAAALLAPLADPRIRLITNGGKTGFASQLNQGLRECRSEWVARMDADDIAFPERLAKQLAFAEANPQVDVQGSQIELIDNDGVRFGHREYPRSAADILRQLPRANVLAHPTVLYRRTQVLHAGGYQFEFPVEDYDLWTRLALSGAVFGNHPERLLAYRVTSGASKGERLKETLRLTIELKRRYWLGHMTFGDRVRYFGERVLLQLPSAWIYKLFALTQLNRVGPNPARS